MWNGSPISIKICTQLYCNPHRRHCVVSLSKNINPSLVLVQPRKTCPYITERLLAGAILNIPGEEDILIKRPVTVHGSILLAELVAILAVLEHLINSSYRSKSLRLFSDSQTALGIITLNWDHKNYSEVIRRIKDYIQQLEGDGWTAGV